VTPREYETVICVSSAERAKELRSTHSDITASRSDHLNQCQTSESALDVTVIRNGNESNSAVHQRLSGRDTTLLSFSCCLSAFLLLLFICFPSLVIYLLSFSWCLSAFLLLLFLCFPSLVVYLSVYLFMYSSYFNVLVSVFGTGLYISAA
jgi:hypothetical protein